MSLYHEAAQVLDTARKDGGSFKSIVFGRKDWKSNQKTLFALTTEASKWSEILSVVLEKSETLGLEKQLTPTLALLLAHDLLLSKKGIALPQKHGLCVAITRHKARLSSELTKARIRLGFATLDALRAHVDKGNENFGRQQLHPRWIRINTLRTSLRQQMESTFADFQRVDKLSDLANSRPDAKLIYIDEHIPDLVAISSSADLTDDSAYKHGKLIFQDKASCFPAYLLQPCVVKGDIVDACAAPGNKTTHLAALAPSAPIEPCAEALDGSDEQGSTIFAFEKDAVRSKTLQKMVDLAGAHEIVRVMAKSDFLARNPHEPEYANVTSLLLDPSCSGTGIIGRDEVQVNVHLPRVSAPDAGALRSKKRKRSAVEPKQDAVLEMSITDSIPEEVPTALEEDSSKLQARLAALSTFQLRLLEHAMSFPAARRITYSTCSIHDEENEHVVVKALLSEIAMKRGWQILRRERQVDGMKKWQNRGKLDAVVDAANSSEAFGLAFYAQLVSDACIRCEKGGEDGTMGFFVAGFVRDTEEADHESRDWLAESNGGIYGDSDELQDPEEEWNGFSDDDTG